MPRSFLTCTLVAAWLLIESAQGVRAQAVFPTPEAGASAFFDALANNDDAAMQRVLGSDFRRFIPTQDVDQDDVYRFLGAWSQSHEILIDQSSGQKPEVAHVAVGTNGWTLPIPLVKTQRGWRFDPVAGRDELLTRRIGRNERAAIRTSLAYLDAQHDYRALTHHYAQRLVSQPGQRDGLYWPAGQGEAPSPLGPLAITMQQGTGIPAGGYHGYHYRILTAQGAHANGGRKSYERDGCDDIPRQRRGEALSEELRPGDRAHSGPDHMVRSGRIVGTGEALICAREQDSSMKLQCVESTWPMLESSSNGSQLETDDADYCLTTPQISTR
jgi:hypothetical protein